MSDEKTRVQVDRSPVRCPYCHDDVDVNAPWVACADCLARHHPECWTEPGRCSSCGKATPLGRVSPTVKATPRASETAPAPASEQPYGDSTWVFGKLVTTMILGALVYRAIATAHLEQTAALFVGIPALLSIILVLTPKPKTTAGMIVKFLTLALVMSWLLLGEGVVCVLMAAPVVLAIGLVVYGLMHFMGWVAGERNPPARSVALVLPMLIMSLEGTTASLSFSRAESVQAQASFPGTPAEVEAALGRAPRFDEELPAFLRLGFPRPVWAKGSGLEVGSTRTIHFAGGEGVPGDLVLRVAARGDGWVRFQVVSDSSKVAHWLDWSEATVRWEAGAPGRTNVTWTLEYRRRLDPAWYFGPLERYAVGKTAAYLLECLANPHPEKN